MSVVVQMLEHQAHDFGEEERGAPRAAILISVDE
jgi:hypothetical protein